MRVSTTLNIARVANVIICVLLGVTVSLIFQDVVSPMLGFMGGLILATFFILIEKLLDGLTLRSFSSATFGLGVGLLFAWLINRIGIDDMLKSIPSKSEEKEAIALIFRAFLYAGFGFIGAAIALRTNRDDFAFIIPYVRFRQSGNEGVPMVLDAAAVMDSRVSNIFRSGFLDGRLIIPHSVLQELHALTESPQAALRQRGQLGLDLLEKIQQEKTYDITIHELASPNEKMSSQEHIIATARFFSARLLTNDESLAKVARLQGIKVLNLHELHEALKPAIVVGETMKLALVRTGKEEHQAVGYIQDGTMIVVNQAAPLIGTTQKIRLISTIHTANGMMVFAELEGNA